MARRPVKSKQVLDWQIARIGKVASYVGKVQASDAAAAIKLAIQKFDLRPKQRDSIAARPILVR